MVPWWLSTAARGRHDDNCGLICGVGSEDSASASSVVAGRRRPSIAAVSMTVVSVEMGYESLFMQGKQEQSYWCCGQAGWWVDDGWLLFVKVGARIWQQTSESLGILRRGVITSRECACMFFSHLLSLISLQS